MGAALGRLALTATLLVMVGGTAGRAASVLVIGDLPAANDGKFSAVASLGGTYSKAVGFTMPAESFDLASVTLRLREQPGSYNTLSVQLYGGNTNPSGQALVDFDTPTIPTQAGDVTFTPKTSFTLKGDTTYWLYLSGKSNTLNGIVWYASNPALLPTGIATSAGARFSNNQAGVTSALTPSSVMNTFSVTGSFNGIASIPEPAGLIQVATAVLVGLAYAGWRARRARGLTRGCSTERTGRAGSW
jgi:hypothetical protein